MFSSSVLVKEDTNSTGLSIRKSTVEAPYLSNFSATEPIVRVASVKSSELTCLSRTSSSSDSLKNKPFVVAGTVFCTPKKSFLKSS